MHRKRLLAGVLAIVALLSGAAISGILFAEGEDYSEVVKIAPNDPDIVAVVDGLDVARSDLTLVPYLLGQTDPPLSETDAVARFIVGAIGGFIVQAEVERRGLVPTIAETEEFMKPHKEACDGPDGAECREFIQLLGLDYDEAWVDFLPEYQRDLGKIRLMWKMLGEKGLQGEQGGTHEQALQARSDFGAELRANANIVWHDQGLKEQYDRAVDALDSR